MRFDHKNTYPAPVSEVLPMLTSPAFRELVCRRQHALSYDVSVNGSTADAGAEVVIRQTQSMKGAPGIATRLTGDTIELVQRESWRPAAREGAAELAIEIPGKPAELRGAITLRDLADGTCEEVFTGEVKVRVPLVGGKLESLISGIVVSALRREGETGREWLAGDRG